MFHSEEIYVEKLPYTMDEEWNIIIIWTYTKNGFKNNLMYKEIFN
jgi:hypothetical protein